MRDEDREKRMARINQGSESNWKTLKEECRKMRECVHCGAYNGTVKKGDGLKVIHAKFAVDKDIHAP